jgi:carboxyl-terminal processing protease
LSRYGWTATLIILGLFAVGFTWTSSDDLYANIRIFDKAALTVSSSYVEQVDEDELIKAAIDGMVSKLDHFSKFLAGPDYLNLIQETDGEFEGIGVSLEFHHDTLTIESVLDGTPAYYHGLKTGDRIIAIEGRSTISMESSNIKSLFRGPKDTVIRLKVLRPNDGIYNFSIARDIVEVKSISYYGMVDGLVGYARLARFSEGCSNDLANAIREMKREGMQSLILDLRDNPGGLLIEAVKVASLFLPEGDVIVNTRGRAKDFLQTYKSDGEPDFQTGALAIIVNGQTASAAEILAGAIQDHDRGVIIGSSSFGKGLIQQVLQLSEESALKLTTSKYYLPSGRCLQRPDWSSSGLIETQQSERDSIFTTVSGRLVFGAGGILPDIYIDAPLVSDYVEFLKKDACFFDFSLEFVKGHVVTAGFQVDDSILADFRRFVLSRDLGYQDDQRMAYTKLRESLKAPGPNLKNALNSIDRELALSEQWQFESHFGEIRTELLEAILLRALGEGALYRYVYMPTHPEVAEALLILTDMSKYNRILASN